jgi:hypothetical protein
MINIRRPTAVTRAFLDYLVGVVNTNFSNVGTGGYDGDPTVITQDSTHRFVSDAEKTTWNAKANALGADDNYVTDAEKVKLSNLSGTNTGDNATNTQYSGLSASKQDALVSGTNIKTVNSTTLLGSGDLAVQATLVSGTNIKTVGGATLLGSGELVTGTPSGAKYLRDDLSWQTVTATPPDIALSLLAPPLDQTITAGYSASTCDYYEIADTKFLECGDGAVFEIL